jgi:formylglycine-generating enzyme required for sulfatase activity
MFCRWLARAPGLRGARLPRELEWATACRAGDPAGVEQRAFHKKNAGHRLQRTCQLSPSSAGFYDLPGNVREWCEDPFVDGGGEPDAARVVRGACFLDEAEHLSPDRRLSAVPDLRSDLIGFRVLLERTDSVEANPWGLI